ncbi:MAG TPA: response regulator [Bryobacteraceae bacterium]|nr:response regulator [Bryobacteraceae bacterium]
MARTILIVEDTDFGLDALEVALDRMPGVGLRTVRTAEEALHCLGQDQLDGDICAVITDLHLPQMDGFELIETLRSRPGRRALPILVISGDSDPKTPSRLKALGADAYFQKPFSPIEVRNRLEQLIYAS